MHLIRKKWRSFGVVTFIGIVVVTTGIVQIIASAAAPGLYFSASNTTVTKGNQFTVSSLGNGTNFNAAGLDVVFDPSAVRFISFTPGAALSSAFSNGQTSGGINYVVYSTVGTTGDGIGLGTFTFEALRGNGTTTISYASSSSIQSEGSAIATGGSPITITLAGDTSNTDTSTNTPSGEGTTNTPTGSTNATSSTPTKNPSSGTTGTPPSPTTPNSTQQTPEQTKDTTQTSSTTAPKILSVEASGFARKPISIYITTDKPTRSIITYGRTNDNQSLTARSDTYNTSYDISLGDTTSTFTSSDVLYYTVEVIDDVGNKTTSKTYTASLIPVEVKLFIKDISGGALSRTAVIINKQEYVTDDNGCVALTDIVADSVRVVRKEGSQHIGTVHVVADKKTQIFELSPSGVREINEDQTPNIITLVAVVVTTLTILLISGFGIKRYVIPKLRNKKTTIQ